MIIEAKAHADEFKSSCAAKGKSKIKIVQILNDTKKTLKITKAAEEDLKEAYKQEKAYFGFDDNFLSDHGIYELTINLRDKEFAHIYESVNADVSLQKIIDLMEKTCK